MVGTVVLKDDCPVVRRWKRIATGRGSKPWRGYSLAQRVSSSSSETCEVGEVEGEEKRVDVLTGRRSGGEGSRREWKEGEARQQHKLATVR